MTRQRRRLLQAVTAMTAATALLAGCAGAETSGPEERETVIWYVQKSPNLTTEVFDGIAAGFEEANPQYDVEVIDAGGQEVGPYYQTLITTGSAPDLGYGLAVTADNAELFRDLADVDWVQELADGDPIINAYALDGEIKMLSIGLYAAGVIFYNKDLFAEAGIDSLPTSAEELTDAAEKLADLGAQPVGISGDWALATAVHALARPTILAETTTWYQEVTEGDDTYAGSGYEQALALLDEWIKAGYVRADALGLKYEVVSNDFLTGQYGMYPMGSFLAGSAAQLTETANIGAFAAPTFDGDTPAPVVATGAFRWTVPAEASNPEGGIALLHYLATDEDAIRAMIQAEGAFHADVSYDATELSEEIQEIIASASLAYPFGSVGANAELPNTSAQLGTVTAELFTGAGTPASIAAQMDDWWQANK